MTASILCNLVQQQEKTPYQLWNKQAPPINKLQPFGCRAWVQIPEANRKGKFYPVAWEGIFIGYTNQTTAYKVLRVVDKAVIISRHVKFDESFFPALSIIVVSDPCVFFRKGDKPIGLYVHVDNLAIFGPNLTDFKTERKRAFDMKDIGKAGLLLGMKITHENIGFTLSQEHYINTLAQEYELERYSPVNTPLKPNIQTNIATKEEETAFAELNIK
ncbi:hypothetical protein O181_030596 [Austropuccinia psidii MF-1]|uniref:Reverse transcriptase Ty1/copia-type domain-containing protein n=1 Tax=Austropuccinia psidii MF-1 TaxID=1389203 RepID=A0A9Q3CYS8_9BASI|nr:hypothetical protein [Austropuccinia psidii MF-1]